MAEENIKTLSLDLETYSSVSLKDCGVYPYAESDDFEILLLGYSVNGGQVQVIDMASGENVPEEILKAIVSPSVTKWAYNASFERVCLSYWLRKHRPDLFKGYGDENDTTGNYLDPASWRCSMIWAAYLGLPLSLEGAGAVLKLQDQKMSEGKDLIKYFCIPCSPTKVNGGRTRNLPSHAPDKWSVFKAYNKRDVETEMAIQARLSRYPVPAVIWSEYCLDQTINDRGILVDMDLVEAAIKMDETSKEELSARMREITALENPNSVAQMKVWLKDNGLEAESLGKKDVASLVKTAPPDLQEALRLRLQISKSSVKKYQAMKNCVCLDGRARGCFQFYGANRSGRWAGRHIQLQNLPQNHLEDLEEARSLVKSGDYEAVKLLYGDVPDTLSQLIRTAFIAKPGYKFIVSDFSAIEARVLSFLAGEQWRLDVFENNGDIYCASASAMFKVPVEKHGINGHLRQKGKQAELACIAEHSLVLTDSGLVPVEDVTTEMKLWDGTEWVEHQGVVFKGEREVITYDGLTATPDHLVWIEGKPEPVQFGFAAASRAHLIKTGDGGKAIRLGENNITGETLECKNESLLRSDQMHRLWFSTMAEPGKSQAGKVERLSAMFPAEADSSLAIQAPIDSKAEVRESKVSWLSKLWSKRNILRFSQCHRSRSVSGREVRIAGKNDGNRQDRYKRKLCTGKSTLCRAFGKLHQSTKERAVRVFSGLLAIFVSSSNSQALSRTLPGGNHQGCGNSCIREKEKLENHQRTARLYDIRNAGPRHRFTVSNCLVHNCGYGGSVGALKAMGALDMGLTEEELLPLVQAWRNANPNIVRFWWSVDAAVKRAILYREKTTVRGINFIYKSGMLFIELPSGRRLSYVKPHVTMNEEGREQITYEGTGGTKKWERIESYGPKITENIVQAISRDILAFAMKNLSSKYICGHVHDELIIECPEDTDVESICKTMKITPPWFEGIRLNCDGYQTKFYRKD